MKPVSHSPVLREAAGRWTSESVGRLTDADVTQLRENATRLGADEVVALCDAALASRGVAHARPAPAPQPSKKSHLVPRRSAFEMRGVSLRDMSSWGGVRSSNGGVVLSLWAGDVRSAESGGCECLLWEPNQSGSRPWSDTPAGRERLQHCELVRSQGEGEAFLVYGERHAGYIPEEKAQTVKGADPNVLIRFEVLVRGNAYWAVWGGASASRIPSAS